MARRSDAPARARAAATHSAIAPAELWRPGRRELSWLVGLRWLALLCVAAVIAVARGADLIESAIAPALVTAALAVANGVWQLSLRETSDAALDSLVYRMLLVQLACDYLALTLLLHFAGGTLNPFSIFFVFHAALGAIVLPRGAAWLLPSSAVWLHSCVAVAELRGLVPYHPLHLGASDFGRDPLLTAGHLVALWAAIGGVVLFVRTVRVRQEAEEALRRSRERVAQSRERLARVGEIAAGVAHSVRNPLHGALNCVELLQGHADGDDEMLEMLAESLQRIERVTHRLLSLTRERPLARRATNVADLLHDAVAFAATRARAREVRFELEVERLSQPVLLDPDLMLEVLINVLDNAVDASPPGGEVRIHAHIEMDRVLVVEVTDQGNGLTAEVGAHAFDPFFTTKPIGEGTGIGLALGKRVMIEHGGQISLRPVAGGGAMLRLTQPVEGSDTTDEAQP